MGRGPFFFLFLFGALLGFKKGPLSFCKGFNRFTDPPLSVSGPSLTINGRSVNEKVLFLFADLCAGPMETKKEIR